MKLDRMIGILAMLLQRDSVTAPELARRFEVSRRTIQRDVDALCRAGIPIASRQGSGGGFSVMEGYRVDRALLTSPDMRAILAGLRSLDSVSGTRRYAQLMEKLSPGSSRLVPGSDSILIDLAGWYREPLSEKIALLETAIDAGLLARFHYYAPSGESEREIEPYYILFQWGSWYVHGWCRDRRDWRLFKLNRLAELRLGEAFEKRDAPWPDLSANRVFPERFRVKALIEPRLRWRLVEEYGPTGGSCSRAALPTGTTPSRGFCPLRTAPSCWSRRSCGRRWEGSRGGSWRYTMGEGNDHAIRLDG